MIIIWRVLYIFVFLTYFWDFWHCCCLDARCSALIVLSHPLSPHKHHTLALLPHCTYPCTVSYLSCHKIPYHSWHFSLLTSALSRHKKSRHFFLHHPLYLLRHKRSLAPGLTLVRCQEEVSQTRRREGYVVTHTNGETSSHDGINTYLTWYFHMGSGSGSLEDDAKKAGGRRAPSKLTAKQTSSLKALQRRMMWYRSCQTTSSTSQPWTIHYYFLFCHCPSTTQEQTNNGCQAWYKPACMPLASETTRRTYKFWSALRWRYYSSFTYRSRTRWHGFSIIFSLLPSVQSIEHLFFGIATANCNSWRTVSSHFSSGFFISFIS